MKIFISFVIFLGLIMSFIHSVQLTNRIIGGRNVLIEDFPHQVSLKLNGDLLCGGSIISSSCILTSAGCVSHIDQSQLSIKYGSTDYRNGISVQIKQVRIHSDFEPDTNTNDLAILKLSNDIQFNSNAQAIALTNTEISAGRIAWISGWGNFVSGGGSTSHLQATYITIITNTQCNSSYNGIIFDGMICAERIGYDACQGDAGGPLVSGGKLIGIISWGYGCADPRYPGVYTDVYYYRDWILNNMH